jgi:rubrerythrin
MFGQMMEFMLQMVMVKMMFNELPHALGLFEPFDTDASKIEPEYKARYVPGEKAQLEVIKPKYIGMSDPASIEEGLRQSMREEETAIAKYGTRAANARLNGDDATARIYERVAKDEDNHYVAFGSRLNERMRGQTSYTNVDIESI